MIPNTIRRCLTPECGRPVVRRDLCVKCASLIDSRIKRKLTTWADEEAAGRCLPARKYKPFGDSKR